MPPNLAGITYTILCARGAGARTYLPNRLTRPRRRNDRMTGRLPVLALSGRRRRSSECPLSEVKRTCRLGLGVSANDPKRKWITLRRAVAKSHPCLSVPCSVAREHGCFRDRTCRATANLGQDVRRCRLLP